jgi:hypothetical protein
MNEALVREMTQRMQQALSGADPEALFKTWMPAATQGFEQWHKMFWNQLSAAMSAGSKPGKP